jgi:hypothetical protein
VFHLAGGEVVTAPIRERFEIQVVPPVWGREPFLAVTDTSDYNLPRFEGRWSEAGGRLTEQAKGWSAGTTCGAGRTLIRGERSNGSSSSRAARGSSSPALRPATLMSTRSSARRPGRCGWYRRTGGAASSMSAWTGGSRLMRQAEISGEFRVDGNSWLACRAFGVDYHLDEWGRRVFAHTSPVYVAAAASGR